MKENRTIKWNKNNLDEILRYLEELGYVWIYSEQKPTEWNPDWTNYININTGKVISQSIKDGAYEHKKLTLKDLKIMVLEKRLEEYEMPTLKALKDYIKETPIDVLEKEWKNLTSHKYEEGIDVESIKPQKKVLFTTEDGVDMYDDGFGYSTDICYKIHPTTTIEGLNNIHGIWRGTSSKSKYFHKKENAIKYIQDKPKRDWKEGEWYWCWDKKTETSLILCKSMKEYGCFDVDGLNWSYKHFEKFNGELPKHLKE